MFLSEEALNTAYWLILPSSSSMSRKVSRAMICLRQQQVTFPPLSFLLMSYLLLWSSLFFLFSRGWPILGAPVWQHMLPPACPASLHESGNNKRPATDYGADMVRCHFTSLTHCYFNPRLPLMSFSRGRTLTAGQVSLGSSGGRSYCVSRVRKTLNVRMSHWLWSQSNRFVLIVQMDPFLCFGGAKCSDNWKKTMSSSVRMLTWIRLIFMTLD